MHVAERLLDGGIWLMDENLLDGFSDKPYVEMAQGWKTSSGVLQNLQNRQKMVKNRPQLSLFLTIAHSYPSFGTSFVR